MTTIDDEILAVIPAGDRAMTYVVANRLRMRHKHHKALSTARVLRRLKALEAEGKVQRVPSAYLTQICWKHTGG